MNINPIAMDNNRLLALPEMERSTHFLAIRITDSEIKENIRLLQQQIVEKEEVNTEILCNVEDAALIPRVRH